MEDVSLLVVDRGGAVPPMLLPTRLQDQDLVAG